MIVVVYGWIMMLPLDYRSDFVETIYEVAKLIVNNIPIIVDNADQVSLEKVLETLNYINHLMEEDNIYVISKCKKGIKELIYLLNLMYRLHRDSRFDAAVGSLKRLLQEIRDLEKEECLKIIFRGPVRGEDLTLLRNLVNRRNNLRSSIERSQLENYIAILVRRLVEKNNLAINEYLMHLKLRPDEISLLLGKYNELLKIIESLIVDNNQQQNLNN